MYRVGILLCIVAVGLHIVTGDMPDSLEIHCNVSASNPSMVDIIIDTPLQNSSYICEEGKICTQGIEQPGTSSKPTLKSCQKDERITIVVAKSSSNKTCGGYETVYFKLYCLTGNNVSRVVNHSVKFTVQREYHLGNQATKLPKEGFDLLNLAMEFYTGSSKPQKLQTPNIVTIGEVVHVFISGPNGFALQVRNCTAKNSDNKVKIELLDISGRFSTENTGGVLLSQFSTNCSSFPDYAAKPCSYAQLHAFHFKDSMEVNLECSIDICSDPKQCTTTGKRRRRSANLRTQVLRESLYVYDALHGTDVQDRSNARAIGGSLVLTTLGVLLAFTGFI